MITKSKMNMDPLGTRVAPIFGPAVVLSVDPDSSTSEVMLEAAGHSGDGSGDTRVSVPCTPTMELQPGDRVLVAGSPDETVYVLSVLEKSNRDPESPRLVAHDGSSADLDEDGHIRVRNARGAIVFEYDGTCDRSTVHPAGHLEIDADRGMTLKSRAGIRLESRELEIESERARVKLEETKFEGTRIEFAVGLVRTVAGRLETVAKTVISKANGVYAQVTELSQLRTGRRRVLVDSTYELRSEKANLRSKRDFKIDGEQIELG